MEGNINTFQKKGRISKKDKLIRKMQNKLSNLLTTI